VGLLFKRRKSEDGTVADAGSPSLNAAGVPLEASRPTANPNTGLGVPPYRAASPKEVPMSRASYPTPLSTTPAAPMQPQSGASSNPTMGVARPNVSTPRPTRDPAERRTLVVGRGISVQGTVQDAERLVVEGTVEASMIHATELSISPGGVFKGEVEVEDAEVAGTMDGTLTARGNLVIRGTGRVLGTARYRRLQVEDGGQVSGHMEMLSESAKTETARSAAEPG